MVEQCQIRSVSFDTSFLLKDDSFVDRIIDALVRDRIACFVTATVASELEQLKIWGRITESTHKKAIKRWTHAHATVIDFKNRLLSDALGQACIRSMEDHGVPGNHVVNDCNILVSALKNGVDLFLSEDFHFNSAITKEVINEVKSAACNEYHLMCDTRLYSINARTFIEAYSKRSIDLNIVRSRIQRSQKKNHPIKRGKEGKETRHAAMRRTKRYWRKPGRNAVMQHQRHRKTRAQIGKTRPRRTSPFLTIIPLCHQNYLNASC